MSTRAARLREMTSRYSSTRSPDLFRGLDRFYAQLRLRTRRATAASKPVMALKLGAAHAG